MPITYSEAMERYPTREREVEFGVLWERDSEPGIVVENLVCGYGEPTPPCPHCHGPYVKEVTGWDNKTHTRNQWICPHGFIAFNEGGYCSVGLCLDCLKELLGGG